MKTRRLQLPGLSPGRVDAALAALVVLGGVVEVGDRLVTLPSLLLVATGLLVRRRHPLGALALGVGGMVYAGALSEEQASDLVAPFLGVVFLVFSMATRIGPPHLYWAAAGTMAGATVSLLIDPFDNALVDFVLSAALLVAAPVAGGRLLRSRMELTAALREKAARAERDRARHSEAAVEAERTRIAGELHDVVAHALGAMTVQAAAARRLSEKDAARGASAFRAVEETGREALIELRRLLGVLRRADGDLALAPQPRLAFLEDLARRATAGGLRVRLDVDGEPASPLPTSIDLVAYRVVQEALNEAHRQGGAGNATVRVRHRHGEVEVEVVDDGADGDRRLLGMRERVRVYGGQLEIAPRREGGHRVRARLPVEAAA